MTILSSYSHNTALPCDLSTFLSKQCVSLWFTVYPHSVAEVELQRDLLYEQQKGVCRTLQSYLQKLSVTPSTEWTHTHDQQHTAAAAHSTGELRNHLSVTSNSKPGSMTALKDTVKAYMYM